MLSLFPLAKKKKKKRKKPTSKNIYSFYIPISTLPIHLVHLHASPLPIQSLSPPNSRPPVSKNQSPTLQVTEGLGTYSYTEARKGDPFRSMASRGREETGSGKDPTPVVGGPA